MKLLKFFILLILIKSSFIIGGYFGFLNGFEEKSKNDLNCFSDLNIDSIGFGMINHSLNYNDEFLEILLFNTSNCFYFDNVNVDCYLYKENEKKLLSFKLNSTLLPQESGVLTIKNKDLISYDSIRIFKINFRN